ncbi:STAS domain protein, partial [Ostertagia ostertagi]
PRFTAAQLDTIPPQHVPEGVTVLKFESPLHFANVTLFTDKISELITSVKEDSLLNGRAIVVDCTAMAYVDSMGLDALREVYNDAKEERCGLAVLWIEWWDLLTISISI